MVAIINPAFLTEFFFIAVISSNVVDAYISIDVAITYYAKLTDNDYYLIKNDIRFVPILLG